MKKHGLFLILMIPLLFACNLSPQATSTPPTQLLVETPTQPPAPTTLEMPVHPAILGTWMINKTQPLTANYSAMDAQGGTYSLPFSFQLGETGKKIEFANDVVIYDSIAYEYQWVDSHRIRLAINIGLIGNVWLVYDLKLNGDTMSLLDDRDKSAVVILSKP